MTDAEKKLLPQAENIVPSLPMDLAMQSLPLPVLGIDKEDLRLERKRVDRT